MVDGIADMLTQSALASSQKAPDLMGGIAQGIGLATHVEQVQQQRQQMEIAKQQQELAKIDKLTSAMATGAAMKSMSARNAYFKNYIPNVINALGLQNFIPPETMSMIQSDPEQAKKMTILKNQILNNEITYGEALKKMSPEEFAAMDDDMVKQMDASAKFATQQEGLDTRMQNRIAQQEKTRNLAQAKEARSKVDSDQILKIYTPRLEGAAKIGELIDSAKTGKVVSNQAFLGQLNAEIARLETGTQSPGLHASEKTELESSRAKYQAIVDKITGKPTASVSPEILDAASKMVNELQGSYTRGIDSRIEVLKSGLPPAYADIVQQKHDAIKNTYAPRFGGKWGEENVGNPPAPSAAGKPLPSVGSVIGEAWKQKVAGIKSSYTAWSAADKQKYLNGASAKFGKTIEEIKAEMEK